VDNVEKAETVKRGFHQHVPIAVALGIIFFSGAVSWATVELIGAREQNSVQTRAIDDSEACRAKLLEMRNREQDCHTEASKRDVEDLRQRLLHIEDSIDKLGAQRGSKE